MSEAQPLIQVFTFKDGLLARLAHDLRLSLAGFEIDVTGDTVQARMWPESLQVDGVMRNGQLRADELSVNDRAKIQANIRQDVLSTRKYPEIRVLAKVQAAGSGWKMDGQLELCGRQQPLSLVLQVHGNRLVGQCEIRPSRWGIKPYKALAGAIKLQDRVRIEVSLPNFEGEQHWRVGLD
ncbi:MAG: YceI family protein [Nannocystaceae bacterium]